MKRIHCSLIIALVGIIALPIFNGCSHRRTLTIRTFIDGSDIVKVSGSKLWFEHQDFDLPGRNGGVNYPTYINGAPWMPEWNDKVSAPYEGVKPPFQAGDARNVKLTKRMGRGTVSIVETLEAGTLSIRIDDNAQSGAAWYEIVVSW